MAQEQRSIDELLHTIPQEIYDRIYEETFTAPGQFVTLTTTYTPPHLLSIDRASRSMFAASYYANTTFVYNQNLKQYSEVVTPWKFFDLWLKSLDRTHRSLLRHLKWQVSSDLWEEWQKCREIVEQAFLEQYGGKLVKKITIATRFERSGDRCSWRLGRGDWEKSYMRNRNV